VWLSTSFLAKLYICSLDKNDRQSFCTFHIKDRLGCGTFTYRLMSHSLGRQTSWRMKF
jgi:hypothetical protein